MAEPKAGSKVDLWGAAFVVAPRESAPVVLLREQADALTERTNGLIRGVVLKEIDKGTVWASLYAKVPSLQDYMYKLLTISHSLMANPDDPHPLCVDVTMWENEGPLGETMIEDFPRWLGDVLSSEAAHAVITNLLRYSPDRVAS